MLFAQLFAFPLLALPFQLTDFSNHLSSLSSLGELGVEDYEKEEAGMVAFRDSIEHLREYISNGHPAFSQDELAALLRHGHAIEDMRIRYLRGPQRKC
jgi:hypothetical protein